MLMALPKNKILAGQVMEFIDIHSSLFASILKDRQSGSSISTITQRILLSISLYIYIYILLSLSLSPFPPPSFSYTFPIFSSNSSIL